MKKNYLYPAFLMIVTALLLLHATWSHGQSEAESASGLMMENQQDASKSVLIRPGYKMKVTTLDGRQHKGELNGVGDSSITIGSEKIPFSKTEKVKVVKGEGSKVGGVFGIVFGAITFLLGFLFSAVGLDATKNGSTFGEGCGGAVLLLFGVMIAILGSVFLLVGLIAFGVGKAAGRTFRMDGKWRMKRAK